MGSRDISDESNSRRTNSFRKKIGIARTRLSATSHNTFGMLAAEPR
jgi:hypothetical protein